MITTIIIKKFDETPAREAASNSYETPVTSLFVTMIVVVSKSGLICNAFDNLSLMNSMAGIQMLNLSSLYTDSGGPLDLGTGRLFFSVGSFRVNQER